MSTEDRTGDRSEDRAHDRSDDRTGARTAARTGDGGRWDPVAYQRYAGERGRPFVDLMARVGAEAPAYVVDLGCGPGPMTASLADRWPQAYVQGIDASPDMIAAAEPLTRPGHLEFAVGDVRSWRPERPVDVLVSNATLQWVPGHRALLQGFVDALAPGGWLAFQVPGNFGEPSHTLLADLAREPAWAPLLGSAVERRPGVDEPRDYLATLDAAGCVDVDVWETTYLYVLTGDDPVFTWISSTGARPYLQALEAAGGPGDLERFVETYKARLREAYPRQAYGTVLPYRRLFAVARKPVAGKGIR